MALSLVSGCLRGTPGVRGRALSPCLPPGLCGPPPHPATRVTVVEVAGQAGGGSPQRPRAWTLLLGGMFSSWGSPPVAGKLRLRNPEVGLRASLSQGGMSPGGSAHSLRHPGATTSPAQQPFPRKRLNNGQMLWTPWAGGAADVS